MAFEAELKVAIEAAELAGEMIRAEYEIFVPIPDAPISISTHVDTNSQELILKHLHAAFPGDAMCAEENTPTYHATSRTGSRVWVVDPIDGTRGFAMKNGEFSVMIGLMVDGKITVGVVLEPAINRLTYAALGSGCWTKSGSQLRRCHVTSESKLGESTLIQSHYKPGKLNLPFTLLGSKRRVETYSAGVKLAFVARGEVDLYANDYANFHDWDICAGQLLVEEAGGIVTEFHGKPIQYLKEDFSQDGGLLATNGLLHSQALEKLREVPLGG